MSVEVIDKIKPKNNGDFPLVDAADVEMPDGSRLSDHDFLESSKLPDAVNLALAQAKASGEFDGKDGRTPVKGVDYFDGKDGKTPVKGVDYFDGADGKTPVKGVDYYTDADKQEIISEVLDQIEIPEGSGGSGGSAELPVFDLAAMGLAAVTLPTGLSAMQTDTSALLAALAAGSVKFIIPVNMGGATINVQVNMQGFTDGATVYQCSTLFVLEATFALFVTATAQGIQVMIMPAATAVGFPAATAADNGKIMEVVNGSWAAVEVKDSSVATFVDDYISSALEGDY